MLSLGLGFGIAVSGPICDRFPRRPLFIASCILVIAATMTLGPDTPYERLLLHMIALGFGAGFYETVLNTIVVEKYPETAGRRLLFIHSGAPAAACVVPLLIDSVRQTSGIEWHETFQWAGLAHVPLIIAACFVTMKVATPQRHQESSPIRLPTPPNRADYLSLVVICVATFSYVGVESAISIFVVDHTAVDLGLPAARAARTISAFWGGLFVGRLGAGLAPNSPGAGWTAILAAAATGVILAFEVDSFGPPEFAMAIVGLLLGGVFPVMIGLAGKTLPASPATALGIAGGLGSLGGFVVPWVTGRLASEIDLPFAFASLAGWLLLLTAAAAAVRFRRTR